MKYASKRSILRAMSLKEKLKSMSDEDIREMSHEVTRPDPETSEVLKKMGFTNLELIELHADANSALQERLFAKKTC